MSTAGQTKLGNLPAMVRLTRNLQGLPADSAMAKRRLIADFCRMIGVRIGAVKPGACNDPKLSSRMRQTLECLLAGDSEKEAAAKLQLSRHTVHIYVKNLHKHYQVSSRGELLARCLGNQAGR